LDGRGVVDLRSFQDEFEAGKPLHTVAEFEDFVFSYRPWVTNTHVQFLQTLLPASRFEEECVFTPCDVRTDNIMVDKDENGDWTVSGIIDWEEAGFYPAYWEAAKSTRCFLANNDDDWYLMLPPCILRPDIQQPRLLIAYGKK
jgi:thiamine kinase-like enzyme